MKKDFMPHIDVTQYRELIFQLEIIKGTMKLNSGFWPVWGNLVTTTITAFTTLGVAFLIFRLTKNKDDNNFRGKLYGDLISSQHELLATFAKKFIWKNLYEAQKALNRIEPSQRNIDKMVELDKELTELETKFYTAVKDYYSNVGIYIYYKKGKTQMVTLKTRLDSVGFARRNENFPDNLNSIDEIHTFGGQQIDEYNEFYAIEIEGLTNQMVESVLKNR